MADLLVAVMQDAARQVVSQQEGQQAGQVQQLQAQQADQQAGQQAGQQKADQQQQAQQAQQGLPPVPGPMFPGNWESPNPTCRLGVSWAGH